MSETPQQKREVAHQQKLINETHVSAAKLPLHSKLRIYLADLNARRRARIETILHPGPRVISATGLKMIEDFEGFSATQYNDGTGTMTIGFGTTSADVSPLPGRLTRSQAEQLLRTKLNAKYAPAVRALGVPLTQNQFDALCSFVYNLGPGVIDYGSHMGNLLRAKRFREAADLMLQFDHAGGQVMLGLQRRRAAERALFLR